MRLTLEGRGIAEVIADSTLLSSCFVILEQAVVYVANVSEQAEHSAGTTKCCYIGLEHVIVKLIVLGFMPRFLNLED